MRKTLRRLAQKAVIVGLGPYIRRELPKWGTVYRAYIGTARTDRFWQGAKPRTVRNKWFGFETQVDLSTWTERSTFFLRRWYDLPSQLLIHAAAGRGGIVVDVGANRGDFTLVAASIVGPEGKVFSFEPNPQMVAVLRTDLDYNGFSNVVLHQVGLGDEPSTLSLHVPYISTGGATFGEFEIPNTAIDNVRVEVGDAILGTVDPDLIKIDVEGFEVRVLRGLRATINRARPVILTEILDEALSRCGTTRGELVSLLESMGYRGYGVGTQRDHGSQRLTLGPVESSDDVVWVHSTRDPTTLCATSRELAMHYRHRDRG